MPKNLENIKEDIIRVTRKLLVEEGYEKLNVRTIATKCGIATGTFYNYFNSKQEIVEEILKIEWNMMLRRIEQGSKAEVSLIVKLETVYTELSVLMNDIHKIWFENFNHSQDGSELCRMKDHKEFLYRNLKDRIYTLIQGDSKEKDYEFLSDVICRLLVTYSYRSDVEFKKLVPVIESLL